MALPRSVNDITVTSVRRRGGRRTRPDPAVRVTLLELVRTIGEITDDETEIVATVIHMLRSGRVKLAGAFRGEPIGPFAD